MKPRGHGPPTLTVVIITWNSESFVERCLESVRVASEGLDVHVIAVDNGSEDRTPELLAAEPGLELVRNAANRGVARGRNQGLRRVRGKYALLLDIDTIVRPDAFRTLLEFMELRPRAGLCGPMLLAPDERLQYTCRRFPTVLTKLARRSPEPFRGGLLRREEMRAWDHASIAPVDYVIGACQIVRAAALEEVGLLDESMFYGPEDIDLCLRMWSAGWGVFYNPDAVVVHKQMRMSRGLLNPLMWRHAVALGRYFRKHRYYVSRGTLYRRLGWPRRRPRPSWGVDAEPTDA